MNVLHCVFGSVLDNGGWAVLHDWLLHCKSKDSRPFLIELLKLYKRLPVTVELLRQNSCAKDIKQLSKFPDESMYRVVLCSAETKQVNGGITNTMQPISLS